MDRYAVIGNPVAHSKSPRIHQMFAEQTGQSLSYERLLAPPDDFAGTLKRFQADGGSGVNVTLPFKLQALKACDEVGERAQRAGAVNTITLLPGGRMRGDNTDGIGLVRDLTTNLGLALKGMNILILGAGGAVRGVLGPLFDAGSAGITIANRTAEKAAQLAAAFGEPQVIDGCGYEKLGMRQYDLIINATSAGLSDQSLPLPRDLLERGGACYDMLYGDTHVHFQRWATLHDAVINADGLGMLVEQAAESFFIWRGVRPETQSVLRELRQHPD